MIKQDQSPDAWYLISAPPFRLTVMRLVAGVALACVLALPAGAQFIERKELSYAAAKAVAENALEACKMSLRADGASPHTMENARRKAYTAMTFKMTTAEFIKRMATEPVRREQTTLPNVIAIDGGVPIKAGNDVVGGIGLSGSPGVDTECVMAGMEKAKDQLQ